MLKDTQLFENLDQVLAQKDQITFNLLNIIKKTPLDNLSEDSRCVFSRKQLIGWMLIMKFLGIASIHQSVIGQWKAFIRVGKDVLYKIKNSEWINWRSNLLNQSWQCMKGIEMSQAKDHDVSGVSCFIVDDSDIPKRGKCMEMIGKIFSHVTGQYHLGYKSLNLAYWSGKHLLHLDFSYHVEMGKNADQGMKKKELKARYSKDRKENSPGYFRYTELFKKKTLIVKSMIRRAIRKGFQAQYLLADSWFFNNDLASFVLDNKLHLISRPKFNNWKYDYAGKQYTIGALIKKLRYSRNKKWNRHLRLHFVSTMVQFNGIDYQLIYFKEKRRGSKWQALITTDKNISAQRAFKIYQTRWAIESSYKELKQTLKYGKCQSRDFDAHIADATQCLMCYNTLSHIKAINHYQSIGALFKECSQEWLQPTLIQRFWKMFYQAIQDLAEVIQKPCHQLIDLLINSSDFVRVIHNIHCELSAET